MLNEPGELPEGMGYKSPRKRQDWNEGANPFYGRPDDGNSPLNFLPEAEVDEPGSSHKVEPGEKGGDAPGEESNGWVIEIMSDKVSDPKQLKTEVDRSEEVTRFERGFWAVGVSDVGDERCQGNKHEEAEVDRMER